MMDQLVDILEETQQHIKSCMLAIIGQPYSNMHTDM